MRCSSSIHIRYIYWYILMILLQFTHANTKTVFLGSSFWGLGHFLGSGCMLGRSKFGLNRFQLYMNLHCVPLEMRE